MGDGKGVHSPAPENDAVQIISNSPPPEEGYDADLNNLISLPGEMGSRGGLHPGASANSSEHVCERQNGPSPLLEYLVTSRMHDMEEKIRTQEDTIRSLREEAVQLRNEAAGLRNEAAGLRHEAAILNGRIIALRERDRVLAEAISRPMEVGQHDFRDLLENSLFYFI